MAVVICKACGARNTVRSQFEVEGECPDCGEEELVEEDAYDEAAGTLRCVDCGRQVDGAPPAASNPDAGRFSVDDPCPLCEGVLVPVDDAPPVRARPEVGLARKVADQLRARVPGLPVDVDALAAELGLEVVRGSFGHDGLLRGTVIEVPVSSRGAERFVIAHEIGHHALRHQVPEDRIEVEANAFASRLLIPPRDLTDAVAGGLDLRALCGRFRVNRQPMVYALQEARLLDHMSL